MAGEHIVEFYRSRDVCSRYRIYHFEDFTGILSVSIDSRKTNKKSPAHSLVFRGFFAKVFGRFSRLTVPQSTYIPREPQCQSPRPNWDSPPPLPQANVGADDWRKNLALCLLCGLHKIREKYIKRYEELSSIVDVYNRY